MRCPKCGYISFDYNQVCPRCNKGIVEEQEKLSLPSFEPAPPSLLGILIGEADDSMSGLQVDNASVMDASSMEIDFNDSAAMLHTDSVGMGEETDFEISLEPDSLNDQNVGTEDVESLDLLPDMEIGEEGDEMSLDIDEISFDDGQQKESFQVDEGLDLDLDFDEIPIDETGGKKSGEGETQGLDLEDLSFDDTDLADAGDADDITLEPEDTDLNLDTFSFEENDEQPEMEIGLDDLKVNETGQLEVSSIEAMEAGAEPEGDFELGDLTVDESGEDDLSLDLGDLALDDIPSENDSPEMSSASYDAKQEEDVEDDMNFEGLSLDDAGPGDDDFSALEGLALDIDESDDDSIDLDLESLIMEDSESESSDSTTGDKNEVEIVEDLDFDLENLDLDLDFDGSKNK